jgi:glycosyltransferase involved in cell wall biosynthesis
MKFSVVTISFNQREFLERTILSVLSQAGVPFEYIIVDPGSTDGSRDIIEKYRDRFSHVIYEKDQGPGDGLNKGFAKADGDILVYLNSDDMFEPGAFAYIAEYLEKHPKCDVVCGAAWVVDGYDRRLRKVWSEPYKRARVAYGTSVQIQPSTYFRKELYDRSAGFNIKNKTNWDGELLADFYTLGANIETVDYVLSAYRLHRDSITNSGSTKDKMKNYELEKFRKLMGRDPLLIDKLMRHYYRAYKHISNPVSLYERIVKGPLFERGV